MLRFGKRYDSGKRYEYRRIDVLELLSFDKRDNLKRRYQHCVVYVCCLFRPNAV
jgi:hypothetical protein